MQPPDHSTLSARDALDRTYPAIERAVLGDSGLRTGLAALDLTLGGLAPGELTLLTGRPGLGRTALALTASLGALRERTPVLWVALGHSSHELIHRVLAGESGIARDRLRVGDFGYPEWKHDIQPAAAGLAGAPLRFLDKVPLGLDELHTHCRAWLAALAATPAGERPDGSGMQAYRLIVVDDLHLLGGVSDRLDNKERLRLFGLGLKQLALATGAAILATLPTTRRRAVAQPLARQESLAGADVLVDIAQDDGDGHGEAEGARLLTVATRAAARPVTVPVALVPGTGAVTDAPLDALVARLLGHTRASFRAALEGVGLDIVKECVGPLEPDATGGWLSDGRRGHACRPDRPMAPGNAAPPRLIVSATGGAIRCTGCDWRSDALALLWSDDPSHFLRRVASFMA